MDQVAKARPTYLFVLPWEPHEVGGVSSVVNNLAKAMAASGSLAPLIAVDSWGDASPRETIECVYFRFSMLGSVAGLGWAKACATAPLRLWRTFRFLRACNARVVNFHYPGRAPVTVALLKRVGLYRGKLLLSYHGTDVTPPGRTIERLLRRFMFDSADHLIACSRSLAERMVSQFDVPSSKVRVIFNGVDESVFDGIGEVDTPLRRDLPGYFVLSIGSFIHRKNHAVLIEAFGRIAHRYPGLHLCIAGADGPERPATEELIGTRGLAGRVNLYVAIDQRDVALLLSKAAVCVQTSLAESFPLAVLEAGASGTPIVVSDISGHDEIVEDGATGLRFPSGDIDACAAAIAAMLDDPVAARRMGDAQRNRVRSRFTLLTNMQEYESLAATE
jgi:glycosyltransferase involved in cell wall biosynthesis